MALSPVHDDDCPSNLDISLDAKCRGATLTHQTTVQDAANVGKKRKPQPSLADDPHGWLLDALQSSLAYSMKVQRAVTALTRIRDRHRYLRFMSVQIGYTTQSFVYEPLNRGARPRARRLVDAVDMAMNVIMNTTRHPLRCVSWLGICASVANVIYALCVAYGLVLGDDLEPGWASLCLQNASMFFFVFLILTVLSEYIGYLSLETRQRPLYHILDESHSDAILPQAVCRNVVREAAERSAP